MSRADNTEFREISSANGVISSFSIDQGTFNFGIDLVVPQHRGCGCCRVRMMVSDFHFFSVVGGRVPLILLK